MEHRKYFHTTEFQLIIAILISVTLGQYYFTSKIVMWKCYFLVY